MFQIIKENNKTKSRIGKFEIKDRVYETPNFVLNNIEPQLFFLKNKQEENISKINNSFLEINTLKIWELFGEEEINFALGIHNILDWKGPIISSSLSKNLFNFPKSNLTINNSGIYLEKPEEGIEDYFDAELSLKIQEELKTDIISAFNLPIFLDDDYNLAKEKVEKSNHWQQRFLEAKTSLQLSFGIIDGGLFDDLIEKNSKFINNLNFDGFILENLSNDKNFEKISLALSYLSLAKPKYLKNLKSFKNLIEFIKKGVDLFDVSFIIAESLNGFMFTSNKIIDLKNEEPDIETSCECKICTDYNSNLNLLVKNKEEKIINELIIHNILFTENLFNLIRKGIETEKLEDVIKYFENIL
jgi:queuine tRNA-ribosyltransferase